MRRNRCRAPSACAPRRWRGDGETPTVGDAGSTGLPLVRRASTEGEDCHAQAPDPRHTPDGRRTGHCRFRDRGNRLRRLGGAAGRTRRSEEHTSELQSLMRISYAVFCLKKKKKTTNKYNKAT